MIRTICTCAARHLLVFLFKQKTAYEMRISDWSSDVCSSDLGIGHLLGPVDGIAHGISGGCNVRHIATLDPLAGTVARSEHDHVAHLVDSGDDGGNPERADRKSTRLNSSH